MVAQSPEPGAHVLNIRSFRIELEFRSVGFLGERKTGVPGEKPLGAEKRTNNKLSPLMTSSPGIEPGPHWWKGSALTTAPSLLPYVHVVHTTAKQVISRRGKNENVCEMSKNEKRRCKACKTVSHYQICKCMTFLLPSSSWLLKLPNKTMNDKHTLINVTKSWFIDCELISKSK